MVGIVVDELKLASPRIKIRFALDVASGVSNHRCSFEVVGEIVKNAVRAFARHALAVEENIFVGQVPAQVAFPDDPRRHIPVERSRAAVGLGYAVAVAVVCVSITSRAGEAVLLIVGVVLRWRRGVERHVACRVILVIRAAGGMNPVVRVGGDAQVFSGAGRGGRSLKQGLANQIPPRVIGVIVAPEFLQAAQHSGGTVRPRISSRSQPIQRVIGESLIAGVVFVISDAIDIPVVRARGAVAEVEVIAD